MPELETLIETPLPNLVEFDGEVGSPLYQEIWVGLLPGWAVKTQEPSFRHILPIAGEMVIPVREDNGSLSITVIVFGSESFAADGMQLSPSGI